MELHPLLLLLAKLAMVVYIGGLLSEAYPTKPNQRLKGDHVRLGPKPKLISAGQGGMQPAKGPSIPKVGANTLPFPQIMPFPIMPYDISPYPGKGKKKKKAKKLHSNNMVDSTDNQPEAGDEKQTSSDELAVKPTKGKNMRPAPANHAKVDGRQGHAPSDDEESDFNFNEPSQNHKSSNKRRHTAVQPADNKDSFKRDGYKHHTSAMRRTLHSRKATVGIIPDRSSNDDDDNTEERSSSIEAAHARELDSSDTEASYEGNSDYQPNIFASVEAAMLAERNTLEGNEEEHFIETRDVVEDDSDDSVEKFDVRLSEAKLKDSVEAAKVLTTVERRMGIHPAHMVEDMHQMVSGLQGQESMLAKAVARDEIETRKDGGGASKRRLDEDRSKVGQIENELKTLKSIELLATGLELAKYLAVKKNKQNLDLAKAISKTKIPSSTEAPSKADTANKEAENSRLDAVKTSNEQQSYGSPYGQQSSFVQQPSYGQQSPYGRSPYGQQPPYVHQSPYGQQSAYAQQLPYGQQSPYEQSLYGQQPPYGRQLPPVQSMQPISYNAPAGRGPPLQAYAPISYKPAAILSLAHHEPYTADLHLSPWHSVEGAMAKHVTTTNAFLEDHPGALSFPGPTFSPPPFITTAVSSPPPTKPQPTNQEQPHYKGASNSRVKQQSKAPSRPAKQRQSPSTSLYSGYPVPFVAASYSPPVAYALSAPSLVSDYNSINPSRPSVPYAYYNPPITTRLDGQSHASYYPNVPASDQASPVAKEGVPYKVPSPAAPPAALSATPENANAAQGHPSNPQEVLNTDHENFRRPQFNPNVQATPAETMPQTLNGQMIPPWFGLFPKLPEDVTDKGKSRPDGFYAPEIQDEIREKEELQRDNERVRNVEQAAKAVTQIEAKVGLDPTSIAKLIDNVETAAQRDVQMSSEAVKADVNSIRRMEIATPDSQQPVTAMKRKLENDKQFLNEAKDRLSKIKQMELLATEIEVAKWSASMRANEKLQAEKRKMENELSRRRTIVTRTTRPN